MRGKQTGGSAVGQERCEAAERDGNRWMNGQCVQICAFAVQVADVSRRRQDVKKGRPEGFAEEPGARGEIARDLVAAGWRDKGDSAAERGIEGPRGIVGRQPRQQRREF